MKRVYCLLLLGIFAFFPMRALAMPAYPGLVKMQQPNGEEVPVYLRGDETIHWMESPDGYSLLYDKDKYIVYATTDETGNMVPSSIVYQSSELRSSDINQQLENIPKNLSYSASQVNTLREIRSMTNRLTGNASLRAATGTVRAICALVQFSDKPLVKTVEEFDRLLNQEGYNAENARGSVKDFYLENSYGQLDLIITVIGPYDAGHPLNYYGENDASGNDNYARIAVLAKNLANYVFSLPDIDPADYDSDNDGYIDAFHFIYAGYGEEAGAPSNTIWAHESGLSPVNVGGGKKLDTYSCSPELRGKSGSGITRIGPVCHEMGHIFGAPDFYDANGSAGGNFTGTGKWDLMAGGSWNGPVSDGSCPAHINMYQKIQMGWVNAELLDKPKTVVNMPNSAQNAVAYTYNTSVSGEYYVLENRQKVGFDSYVPGSGLLIYHVSLTNRDISYNQVNNTHPQKMYPVCASSSFKVPDTTPLSYGSINSAGCPFPGTSGNTSFTDYTTPSAITWKGIYSAKPVTEISEQNKMVSFTFMQPGAEPVNNFTLTKEGSNIRLQWDKPNDQVLGYNIYRNDRFFIKLMGAKSTSYSQNNVGPGNYSYCVTACYDQDESAPSCQDVNIEGNPNEYPPINNLSLAINGNSVELKWDSPAKSDWGNPDKYVVYRDNVWQGEVTTKYFKDDVVPKGNYIYCVAAVYGSRESEWVCIQTLVFGTGITRLNPAGDMKAYPNPVRQGDVLTMDLGNDFAGAKLSFYSVSGQLLRETTVSEQVYRQKIGWAPGVYILQIRKNEQIINWKVVVR